MSDLTTAASGGLLGKIIALGNAAANAFPHVDGLKDAIQAAGTAAGAAAPGFISEADAQAKYDATVVANTANIKKNTEAQQVNNAAVKAHTESLQNVALNTQLATDAQNGNASSIQAGIAVQGQATIISLVLAKATVAQTAALQDQLKYYGMLTDAIKNVNTVASGWNDWLAQLKSSYDSGALSTIAYKQALEDFETQISTQFPGAVGKAKDAITAMIGELNKLIATAGAGGSTPDNSVSGALNKAFNKP